MCICEWEIISLLVLMQVWTDLHHTGFLPFVANPVSSMNHVIRYWLFFFLPELFMICHKTFLPVWNLWFMESVHLAFLTHVKVVLFEQWIPLLVSQCRGNECWGLWKPADGHRTASRRVQRDHLLPEPHHNSGPGECFWSGRYVKSAIDWYIEKVKYSSAWHPLCFLWFFQKNCSDLSYQRIEIVCKSVSVVFSHLKTHGWSSYERFDPLYTRREKVTFLFLLGTAW